MHRHVDGRAILSAAAREDLERVRSIAFAHARHALFDACALTIIAYNTRKDVGNIEKPIADGIQGTVFLDDRSIIELHVEKRRDDGGERYAVLIEEREPLAAPKRKVK